MQAVRIHDEAKRRTEEVDFTSLKGKDQVLLINTGHQVNGSLLFGAEAVAKQQRREGNLGLKLSRHQVVLKTL